MKLLVTGAAGFIGNALSVRLIDRGDSVLGIDNLNNYYDVRLKRARLNRLRDRKNFVFKKIDIAVRADIERLFSNCRFDAVVHLAAQAGVRYSIEHPESYVDSNLVGFANILEGCRHGGVAHLLYASSSSVYGANTRVPFSESDNVDHPISLYAATKKANELMAHSYSHLFRLPTTGLRFFTVYGPWGRPDMALFKFARGILNGESIDVYNSGNMVRDFTYIDDVIDGVLETISLVPAPDTEWNGMSPNCATSLAPYQIFNIGMQTPVNLLQYIKLLEKELGKKADLNMKDLQDGDMPVTSADISRLVAAANYEPKVNVDEGVRRFVAWYKEYYRHK